MQIRGADDLRSRPRVRDPLAVCGRDQWFVTSSNIYNSS